MDLQVLEYGVKNYDVKFILKTDDDAFINVQPIIQQLQTLCESKDCTKERLYMGKMAKHSEVLLQPGHKWNNAVFYNHTGSMPPCVPCRLTSLHQTRLLACCYILAFFFIEEHLHLQRAILFSVTASFARIFVQLCLISVVQGCICIPTT